MKTRVIVAGLVCSLMLPGAIVLAKGGGSGGGSGQKGGGQARSQSQAKGQIKKQQQKQDQKQQRKQERKKAMKKACDSDGDGNISEEELDSLRELMKELEQARAGKK